MLNSMRCYKDGNVIVLPVHVREPFLVEFLLLNCNMLFIDSGNIGYSTGGSDVVRGAGILREDPDDDEDANDDDDDYSGSEPLQRKPQRKDSPPSYNDHCKYFSV